MNLNSCILCGDNLHKLSKSCYLQKGSTNFIIIGESPAKNGWLVSQKAFFDKSGKLQASGKVLQKLLDILDVSIEDIYFTELCKCLIEDRTKLEKCAQNCLPFLKKTVAIFALQNYFNNGVFSTQTLLGIKIKKFSDYVGKIFDLQIGNKKFQLLPIYHPSPLNPKGYKGNIEFFENLQKTNLTLFHNLL